MSCCMIQPPLLDGIDHGNDLRIVASAKLMHMDRPPGPTQTDDGVTNGIVTHANGPYPARTDDLLLVREAL